MKKPRILVVDDTIDILRTLHLLLGDRYEVVLANDGLSGLSKAARYLPDLIILDIMMPKMTGYQFFDQCRKNPGLKDIPIIFVSAKGTPIDQDYGMKKGASAYITKPFDPRDLLKKIEDLLIENPPVSKERIPYDKVIEEEAKDKKVYWQG
jgi:CheY-like chemotaxis protein